MKREIGLEVIVGGLRDAYATLYDLMTVRESVNAEKLAAISAFVGHLVNYVFLQVAANFVLASVESAEPWKAFWLLVLWIACQLLLLAFLLRITFTVQFFVQRMIRLDALESPRLSLAGMVPIVVAVVFWVGMWNVSGAISATLHEFAERQTIDVEKAPPPRRRDPPPSCRDDFCIA